MASRFASVSGLALIVGMTMGVGHASAQSLSDEITSLLAESPELNSLRNQAGSADEGVTEAYAGFLPTVDVSGDAGYEYTDSPTTRTTGSGDPLQLSRDRVTATLRERLFDGWGTDAAYASAQSNSDLAGYNLQTSTQDMTLQGVRAYLDVLRARDLIDLAQQNVSVIETQLNLETERVQRGSGITLDELQAKSRLQIAQERKVAFEGTLKQAMARYRRLFGHDPDLAAMSVPQVPQSEIPASIDDAVAIAGNESPRVAGSEVNVQLADENRTAARSAYYPTLDLVGRLNWEDDVDGTRGIRRDAAVIVEANWQIFSGFATDAGVARSAYEYQSAMNDRSATGRIVQRDVEAAWEQLATSRQRVDLLENAVAIAEEVHASRVKLREAGQETVLNVLDARNDVFNAQINLVSAQYDGYVAVYRLLQAMGRLTPDRLGATAPGDSSSLETPPADFDVASATADAHTVALATDPLPAPEPAATQTSAAVADAPQSVEIAASSSAIQWPEPATTAVAADEAPAAGVTLADPAPASVQTLAVTFNGFEAAPAPEPTTVATDAIDRGDDRRRHDLQHVRRRSRERSQPGAQLGLRIGLSRDTTTSLVTSTSPCRSRPSRRAAGSRRIPPCARRRGRRGRGATATSRGTPRRSPWPCPTAWCDRSPDPRRDAP